MDVATVASVFGLFAAILAVSVSATLYWLQRGETQRRLRALTDAGSATLPADDLGLTRTGAGRLEALASYVPLSPKEMSRLRRRLLLAGFEQPEATVLFRTIELLLPVISGLTVSTLIAGPRGLLFGLLAAAIVYLLPGLWLGRRTTQRQKSIANALPDALDLLLLSIEAGSGMDQALQRVATELRLTYPDLAHEFRTIVNAIRAGQTRTEALRGFAERTRVDDVRALVSILVQTDRFGTSLGQALRTHADSARVRRRQNAEERAQKLGTKLVFPLVLCMFPAMFVVVAGPAVLRIVKVLGDMTR